ncbi:hypothetical protein AB0I10_05475 [Streptomyces sp. NPDC050636]|uniref:hypothetical protein n=1 Tax=Streptomyces sp. NPDC050636 TaxID=3154510 RepID=UPI003441DDEE
MVWTPGLSPHRTPHTAHRTPHTAHRTPHIQLGGTSRGWFGQWMAMSPPARERISADAGAANNGHWDR